MRGKKLHLVLRLTLDLGATALLFTSLAYWWLDNTAHEWLGAGMFALLLIHNAIHRRWWGHARQHAHGSLSRLDFALTAALLAALIALLASSVFVSREVFAFAALRGRGTARQVHVMAAHWVVVAVALHLGVRWGMVMTALRNVFGLGAPRPLDTGVLRIAAIAMAACGARAAWDMNFGDKLLGRPVLDMWDFNESTVCFFLNWLTIVALGATLMHYVMTALRRRRSIKSRA